MHNIVQFVVVITSASFASAVDTPRATSESDFKNLVEQLVSPNPKPITGDEDKKVAPDYRLPPGFDQAKQRPVLQAKYDLSQIGPAAFPQLIDRWDDDRHCMTMFHSLSEYSQNVTVGFICRKIIFDQLQPYSIWPRTKDDPRGKPKRPSYPSVHLKSKQEARVWWEVHKSKSLYELQLEVLDWVIAEEAKRSDDYSQEELEFLKAVKDELLRRKEPMKSGNYDWMNPEL